MLLQSFDTVERNVRFCSLSCMHCDPVFVGTSWGLVLSENLQYTDAPDPSGYPGSYPHTIFFVRRGTRLCRNMVDPPGVMHAFFTLSIRKRYIPWNCSGTMPPETGKVRSVVVDALPQDRRGDCTVSHSVASHLFIATQNDINEFEGGCRELHTTTPSSKASSTACTILCDITLAV